MFATPATRQNMQDEHAYVLSKRVRYKSVLGLKQTIGQFYNYALHRAKQVDWRLLLFLILFLNVKMGLKVIAIVLICVLRPGFKFGFKLKNSRLPLFYLLIMAIAAINQLIFRSAPVYIPATAIGFWALCVLASHQVKLAIEKNTTASLQHTLSACFALNAVVSVLTILFIMIQTRHLNPYTYQGDFQKYFLSTGDYIRGISFDVSITNAVISAMAAVYYLQRSRFVPFMINIIVLLLTSSNTVNIMLMVVFGLMFFFSMSRLQKSMIVAAVMSLTIFIVKVSPQNGFYVDKLYNKIVLHRNISFDPLPVKEVRITDIPDAQLSPEQLKEKRAQQFVNNWGRITVKQNQQKIVTQTASVTPEIKAVPLVLPKDSIHTATFQSIKVAGDREQPLISFINQHKAKLPLSSQPRNRFSVPGKILAFKQTLSYLARNPVRLITGVGAGNFSSKLAFRATGLSINGGFPARLAFISPVFLSNHLDIYLSFFSKSTGFHSVLNTPDSVYDQILGEYGLPGIAALLIFYFGFFVKRYKSLSYGRALLLLMAGVFFTGYWFEQLSVVVLFELLLFLDIKEHQTQAAV